MKIVDITYRHEAMDTCYKVLLCDGIAQRSADVRLGS